MTVRKTPPRNTDGSVTLEQVAAAAGVSASTVSRILNGTAIVSAHKRAAVDGVIARLGFAPNPMARGLAGGRTLSIGVVTQAIDSPFYGGSLRGIEDELDAAGYRPLFVSGHWDPVEEARCLDMLRSRRVDGVIVLTGRLSDAALRACAKQLPVVVTGRTLKARGLFAFDFDHFEGGRLATEHLLGLGHRHIAFIAGDPAHPDARERQRGYRAALQAAGVAHDARLEAPGLFTEESGVAAVAGLLKQRRRFTAVFAANDQMAIGACLGLHQRRLRVPHDVSVVGFDDLSISRYALPPLTTVHHPAYDMGRIAAAAMLQLLQGTKPAVSVPLPHVVVRQSSSAPQPRR